MIVGTGLMNDVIFATGGINTQNEVMRVTSANTVIVKTTNTSTSTTTGALQVKGGVGVVGNVYAGAVYSNNTLVLTSEPVGIAAYAQANNASGNTVALQTVNTTQNTNITAVNTLANAAYTQANSASGNTVALQTYSTLANGNIIALQSQVATLNANVAAVNTFTQAAFNKANTDVTSINTTAGTYGNTSFVPVITVAANGRISSVSTSAISGGGGSTIDQFARDTANTAAANTVALQAVNVIQNTNITNANTLAQAAFNQANTDVTNISTTAGTYGSASLVPVITVATNGRISSVSTVAVSGGGGPAASNNSQIIYIIDGGGATITTGLKGSLEIPFNCNVVSWTLLADQTGSITMNIFNESYSTWGPALPRTNPINFVSVPQLNSASKNNITLGTEVQIASGNILSFNVFSSSSVTRLTVCLKVLKT
jgi:hypothetical protein